jgi:glucose-6-phosphate dehydrogenase assembly protein OpcA
MAPDVDAPTQLERIEDRPIAIDPAAIEGEFASIWQASATGDASSVLLRTLNLVGVGPELWTVERFERVMERLPERHPCRGILAVFSDQQPRLEASISAHCWRTTGAGRQHVCSEEVLLRGKASDARALASTVLALLVAELPVAVWVIGEIDMKADAIARLLEAADSVFVDSADTPDASRGLRDALAAHDLHHVEIYDLAWRRLNAWRDLVAQFFDGEEGVRRLAGIQSIDISCGGDRPASEALLVAGWLVSRLGLSLADLDVHRAEITATLYDASRGVSLRISTDARKIARALDHVVLRTSDAEYVVQCHPESGHMHVREERAGESLHRTVGQVATDDATILCDALDDHSDRDVFIDALRSAVSLLGENGQD